VPIPFLGDIPIIDRITLVDLAFSATAELWIDRHPAAAFGMRLGGTLVINGTPLVFPELQLLTAPADGFAGIAAQVAALVTRLVIQQFAALFRNLLEVAEDWAHAIADTLVEFSGDAADVLARYFHTPAEETGRIMHTILGLPISAVVAGLGGAYGLSGAGLRLALAGAGFLAGEIGDFFSGMVDSPPAQG
jgi:hypothetical protein